MTNDPEQLQNNQENTIEINKSAAKQLEKIRSKIESSPEISPKDIEAPIESKKARIEAFKTAISIEASGNEKNKQKRHTAPYKRSPINKKQRNESYSRTMKRVQSELPINSRIFSKIIHNNVVEKTSDILSNTVARPNAILSGAVTAFVLTILTYAISKNIGYLLSGSEMILAFIIGWIIGNIYDYLRVLFTGNKS